jgi:hypothetical protein
VNLAPEPLEYAREAKANAAIALRLDPGTRAPRRRKGWSTAWFCSTGTGERELRRAVDLMPQNGPNRNSLGTVLLVRGRFDEAIAGTADGGENGSAHAGSGLGIRYYTWRGGMTSRWRHSCECAICIPT